MNSSLRLKPKAALLTGKEITGDDSDNILWSPFCHESLKAAIYKLSESEDELELDKPEKTDILQEPLASCPSPPLPDSPQQKRSRKVERKIREIDDKLQAVKSLLSPEGSSRPSRGSSSSSSRRPQRRAASRQSAEEDDDVIVVTADPQSSPLTSPVREIPLKVRCKTNIHRITVQSMTPLSEVVKHLSIILNVPPPRLILLRDDTELSIDASVGELGLSIADILDCVVVSSEDQSVSSQGFISVKLQSKNKEYSQHFSIHKEVSLGSVFSQFLSQLPLKAKKKVQFFFDGSKVNERDTPAALDMEDGDIIDVWI